MAGKSKPPVTYETLICILNDLSAPHREFQKQLHRMVKEIRDKAPDLDRPARNWDDIAAKLRTTLRQMEQITGTPKLVSRHCFGGRSR